MLNNLNLSEDTTAYIQEEHIPETIARELSYWEKVIFSFDMDPDQDTEGASLSSGAGGTSAQHDEAERRRQGGRAPRLSPASSRTPGIEEALTGSIQSPNPHALLNMQARQSSQQRTLPPHNPQQSGPPGAVDTYALAQLAALSALASPAILSQQHQAPGTPGNQVDPYAVLRQVQSLLFPYGPAGPSTSLPGIQHNYPTMPGSAMSHVSGNMPLQLPNRPSPMADSADAWAQFSGSNQAYPPIDPALTSQYAQLASFMASGGNMQQTQTPGAGPSSGSMNRRSSSVSSGNTATPQSPTNQQMPDDTAIVEDKRRRNTAASARFRTKKKHKVLSLERSVIELEARAGDLEREAGELRRENGWLKEMLIMKGRSLRSPNRQPEQEGEEDEEDEEEQEGQLKDGKDESLEKEKGKGKEKEK